MEKETYEAPGVRIQQRLLEPSCLPVRSRKMSFVPVADFVRIERARWTIDFDHDKPGASVASVDPLKITPQLVVFGLNPRRVKGPKVGGLNPHYDDRYSASKKLRRSASPISGSPGATLFNFPSFIHCSSWSTRENTWSNESATKRSGW